MKKALILFAKSNPPLLEWLRSPLIYVEHSSMAQQLRDLAAPFFSARACMYHYLHMAEGNYREFLCGEQVRLKKYFYVLRPVLACRWIEAHGSMPPMEFAALVADQLPAMLAPLVSGLLERKRAGDELSAGPRMPELSDFLEAEMGRLRADALVDGSPATPDMELLDALFRTTLHEVWG